MRTPALSSSGRNTLITHLLSLLGSLIFGVIVLLFAYAIWITCVNPSGHVPERRSRRVAGAAAVGLAVIVILSAFGASPDRSLHPRILITLPA